MDNNEYISKQKVEKWTTKEKFNALGDLRDIEPGTEYNLTGAIEEGELDSALQSKINGKLTAPATPTAESAVVLGTDGTVSTKPLSELGGKLYVHSIIIKSNDNVKVINGRFLSTRGTNFDVTDDFNAHFLPGSTIIINNVTYGIKYYENQPSNGYRKYVYFNITTYEEVGGLLDTVPTFSSYNITEI